MSWSWLDGPETNLSDGLYRVTKDHFCAGFTVEGGRVRMCAPILKKRIAYWMRLAERID